MDDYSMDDVDEGDDGIICRVCRTEAEPDHPLYHPCKCSGSIRYVHSDCLLQWLSHSKKQYCELCGHVFHFQKVYPADIPDALPLHRLIRKMLVDVLRLFMLAFRVAIVAFTWLVFLPLVMIGAWQSYFHYGSPLAMMVAGRTPVVTNPNGTTVIQDEGNATVQALSFWQIFQSFFDSNSASVAEQTTAEMTETDAGIVRRVFAALFRLHHRILSLATIRWSASDLPERVFKGQILTVSIVVTFLAVFLLREWILQNAGPAPQQEVNQGRVPRPEEFRAEMRARWRQRRLLDFDNGDPAGMLLDPLLRRVIPNPRRPLPEPPQPVLPREELDTYFEALKGGPDENTNEDQQWIDEDEWVDEAGHYEAGSSTRATAGNAAETSITDMHESHSDESAKSPVDTIQQEPEIEQGPMPSLLQQLRRQHRDNADPNMSFEEFLIHQRHSIAGPAEPAPSEPLFPLEPQVPVDPAAEDRRRQEYNHFFEPADPEAFRRQLLLDRRFANDDLRARDRELREEQLRNAARAAELEPAPRPRGFGAQRRVDRLINDDRGLREDEDRRAARAGYLEQLPIQEADFAQEPPEEQDDDDDELIAEVDVGEEVEMGPEPGFDDDDEDEEGGLIIDGDVDGILEAIGMRGPLGGIFQNFLLICIVLNCGICLLVNVPFIIGKVHLMADIGFLVRLIRLPIGLTRLVTDPVIDGALNIAKMIVYALPSWLTTGAIAKLGLGGGATAAATPSASSAKTMSFAGDVLACLRGGCRNYMPGMSIPLVGHLWILPTILGREYREFAAKVTAFGLSDTSSSRAVAIALGLFDLDLALLFTAALGEQYLGAFGKTVADLVEQHGVILKLGFFMSVELLVFPLSMGYFLDFCTLPLFPSGTLHYRWIAQFRNPVLSAFVHWLAGTMFMFAFARFLSTCRSICRKGAMYVIRDPQDPSFSPVREILDKKTSVQLYKLFISATMYLSVMAIPLGGMLALLRASGLPILPLRWSFRDSLSTAPFDVLAFLLFFPVHFKQCKWQDKFKFVTRVCFKYLSETLRLSSYFRGVKLPEEEQAGVYERKLLQLHQIVSSMLSSLTRKKIDPDFYNGTYMRVPYADQVVLLKPRKNVFIPVDAMGIPKSNDDKVLLLMQNKAAQRAGRDPRKDYCMIYLPPFYRIRFWLFGLLLWSLISWAVVLTVLIPVLVGRQATYHFIGRNVHDGINLICGFYTCLVAIRLGKRVGKRVAAFVRKYFDTPRYRNPFSWKRYILKEGDFVLKMARWAYLAVVLYAVLPLLVGLCLELYIFAPLKYGTSDVTPVFYAAEAWCFGIVAMAICYFRTPWRTPILRFLGAAIPAEPDDVPEDRAEAQANARMLADALKPRNLHRVLVPALKYLLIAAFIPGLVSAMIVGSVRSDAYHSALAYRFIHPFLLYTSVLGRVLTASRRKAKEWSVHALEDEYLVEQRVINLEDSAAAGGGDVKVFDPELHAADVHHE